MAKVKNLSNQPLYLNLPDARTVQIPPRATTEPTYRAGDRVQHPTFGVGIVISVRADPSGEIVEVNFAGSAGVKKLDTAFAPLARA